MSLSARIGVLRGDRDRELFGVGVDEGGSSIGRGRGGMGSSTASISEPRPGEGVESEKREQFSKM